MMNSHAVQRLIDDLMNRPIEELVLGESRVAGARYYTVEPIGGNWLNMEQWCIQSFGSPSDVWIISASDESFTWPENGRWFKNNRKFWFRNETDRTLFVMRWR